MTQETRKLAICHREVINLFWRFCGHPSYHQKVAGIQTDVTEKSTQTESKLNQTRLLSAVNKDETGCN